MGWYREFKSAIQGAFFTDKQFNYQLTADEARKLCNMFSKSAARRLYEVQVLLLPAIQHTVSCIVSRIDAVLSRGHHSSQIASAALVQLVTMASFLLSGSNTYTLNRINAAYLNPACSGPLPTLPHHSIQIIRGCIQTGWRCYAGKTSSSHS